MLITKWFDDPLRPTRDVDLLGFGDADPDKLVAVGLEAKATIFLFFAYAIDLDSFGVEDNGVVKRDGADFLEDRPP